MQRHDLSDRSPYSQIYGFSNSLVQMWVLDHKLWFMLKNWCWIWMLKNWCDWALKNWCFQIVVLEKTLENSLECKEIKPDNPKGNQPWIFVGRTVAEAKTPTIWSSDVKSLLIGKAPDTGECWRQRRRGWQRVCLLDSITDLIDMNLKNSGR